MWNWAVVWVCVCFSECEPALISHWGNEGIWRLWTGRLCLCFLIAASAWGLSLRVTNSNHGCLWKCSNDGLLFVCQDKRLVFSLWSCFWLLCCALWYVVKAGVVTNCSSTVNGHQGFVRTCTVLSKISAHVSSYEVLWTSWIEFYAECTSSGMLARQHKWSILFIWIYVIKEQNSLSLLEQPKCIFTFLSLSLSNFLFLPLPLLPLYPRLST